MAKVVLVTGISSELGRAIADSLKQHGYQVFTGGRQQGDITLDISSQASCDQAIQAVLKRTKRLDAVVNVVGLSSSGRFSSFDDKDFQKLLDVNVVGPFRLAKAAAPALKSGGVIINITSLNSFFASPNYALYCASKYALQGLDRALAIELLPQGIHVISVAPGALQSRQTLAIQDHKPARQAISLIGKLLPLTPPELVAERIVEVLTNPHPEPQVIVGRDAKVIYLLQKILPDSVLFGLQNWIWQRQI